MQLEVYNSEELRTTEFPDLTELKVISLKQETKRDFGGRIHLIWDVLSLRCL